LTTANWQPATNAAPLRICHLGKYYPPAPGGIETHVQTLARAQAALGASVQVICVNHHPNTNISKFESDGPIPLTRLGRSAYFAGLDFCPSLLSTLRSLRNFDILHLHTPNPTMILGLSAIRTP